MKCDQKKIKWFGTPGTQKTYDTECTNNALSPQKQHSGRISCTPTQQRKATKTQADFTQEQKAAQVGSFLSSDHTKILLTASGEPDTTSKEIELGTPTLEISDWKRHICSLLGLRLSFSIEVGGQKYQERPRNLIRVSHLFL